jgi:uncharacterized protein
MNDPVIQERWLSREEDEGRRATGQGIAMRWPPCATAASERQMAARLVIALVVLVLPSLLAPWRARADLRHPHDVVELTAQFLEAYWSEQFAASNLAYASPTALYWYNTADAPGEALSTCGPAPLNNAFYCLLDGAIYMDEGFLWEILDDYGDFAVAFVVAHEWTHHVQRQIGLRKSMFPTQMGEQFPIVMELQADCLTGVSTAAMGPVGILEAGDLDEGVAVAEFIGDRPGTSPFSPQAHGTAEQRAAAFVLGLNAASPAACFS